jgi:hypothetical protein
MLLKNENHLTYRNGVLGIKCVLIFSTTFVCYIFNSDKYKAGYV